MYIEKRGSTIVGKETHKGVQPLNGKMMFTDFPIERPDYFVLVMENGDEVYVTKEEYDKATVGESIQYDHQVLESRDYFAMGVFVAVLVVVTTLIFIFVKPYQ